MAKTILQFAGKDYEIPKGQKEFTIGRGDNRNLQVEVQDVSRIHCTLLLKENGGYDLRDDGSKHGTSVRGKGISADLRVELKNDDEIIIGKSETAITVKIESKEEPKLTPAEDTLSDSAIAIEISKDEQLDKEDEFNLDEDSELQLQPEDAAGEGDEDASKK